MKDKREKQPKTLINKVLAEFTKFSRENAAFNLETSVGMENLIRLLPDYAQEGAADFFPRIENIYYYNKKMEEEIKNAEEALEAFEQAKIEPTSLLNFFKQKRISAAFNKKAIEAIKRARFYQAKARAEVDNQSALFRDFKEYAPFTNVYIKNIEKMGPLLIAGFNANGKELIPQLNPEEEAALETFNAKKPKRFFEALRTHAEKYGLNVYDFMPLDMLLTLAPSDSDKISSAIKRHAIALKEGKNSVGKFLDDFKRDFASDPYYNDYFIFSKFNLIKKEPYLLLMENLDLNQEKQMVYNGYAIDVSPAQIGSVLNNNLQTTLLDNAQNVFEHNESPLNYLKRTKVLPQDFQIPNANVTLLRGIKVTPALHPDRLYVSPQAHLSSQMQRILAVEDDKKILQFSPFSRWRARRHFNAQKEAVARMATLSAEFNSAKSLSSFIESSRKLKEEINKNIGRAQKSKSRFFRKFNQVVDVYTAEQQDKLKQIKEKNTHVVNELAKNIQQMFQNNNVNAKQLQEFMGFMQETDEDAHKALLENFSVTMLIALEDSLKDGSTQQKIEIYLDCVKALGKFNGSANLKDSLLQLQAFYRDPVAFCQDPTHKFEHNVFYNINQEMLLRIFGGYPYNPVHDQQGVIKEALSQTIPSVYTEKFFKDREVTAERLVEYTHAMFSGQAHNSILSKNKVAPTDILEYKEKYLSYVPGAKASIEDIIHQYCDAVAGYRAPLNPAYAPLIEDPRYFNRLFTEALENYDDGVRSACVEGLKYLNENDRHALIDNKLKEYNKAKHIGEHRGSEIAAFRTLIEKIGSPEQKTSILEAELKRRLSTLITALIEKDINVNALKSRLSAIESLQSEWPESLVDLFNERLQRFADTQPWSEKLQVLSEFTLTTQETQKHILLCKLRTSLIDEEVNFSKSDRENIDWVTDTKARKIIVDFFESGRYLNASAKQFKLGLDLLKIIDSTHHPIYERVANSQMATLEKELKSPSEIAVFKRANEYRYNNHSANTTFKPVVDVRNMKINDILSVDSPATTMAYVHFLFDQPNKTDILQKFEYDGEDEKIQERYERFMTFFALPKFRKGPLHGYRYTDAAQIFRGQCICGEFATVSEIDFINALMGETENPDWAALQKNLEGSSFENYCAILRYAKAHHKEIYHEGLVNHSLFIAATKVLELSDVVSTLNNTLHMEELNDAREAINSNKLDTARNIIKEATKKLSEKIKAETSDNTKFPFIKALVDLRLLDHRIRLYNNKETAAKCFEDFQAWLPKQIENLQTARLTSGNDAASSLPDNDENLDITDISLATIEKKGELLKHLPKKTAEPTPKTEELTAFIESVEAMRKTIAGEQKKVPLHEGFKKNFVLLSMDPAIKLRLYEYLFQGGKLLERSAKQRDYINIWVLRALKGAKKGPRRSNFCIDFLMLAFDPSAYTKPLSEQEISTRAGSIINMLDFLHSRKNSILRPFETGMINEAMDKITSLMEKASHDPILQPIVAKINLLDNIKKTIEDPATPKEGKIQAMLHLRALMHQEGPFQKEARAYFVLIAQGKKALKQAKSDLSPASPHIN